MGCFSQPFFFLQLLSHYIFKLGHLLSGFNYFYKTKITAEFLRLLFAIVYKTNVFVRVVVEILRHHTGLIVIGDVTRLVVGIRFVRKVTALCVVCLLHSYS